MADYLARMDAAGSAVVAFRLSSPAEWTIGNAGGDATWRFPLAVASTEATIRFDGTSYSSITGGRLTQALHDGDAIDLPGLSLRFRRPHPWTPTATLTRMSGPRTSDGTDVLILASGPVLLGGESDSHLIAPETSDTIALFDPATSGGSDDGLRWKRITGPLDSNPVNRIAPPAFIETDTVRLQIESR